MTLEISRRTTKAWSAQGAQEEIVNRAAGGSIDIPILSSREAKVISANVVRPILLITGFFIILFGLLVGVKTCELHPEARTVQAWKHSFAHVIVPGAEDMTGHRLDVDVSLSLFSYRVPDDVSMDSVLPNLSGGTPDVYKRHLMTSSTLILRYHQMDDLFYEYYVIANPETRRVAVLHMHVNHNTREYRDRMIKEMSRIVAERGVSRR